MTLVQDRKAEESQRPVLVAYKDDLYFWALEQAELLRSGRLDLLDIPNLADEIRASVHCLADKLRSELSRILQHLLKWDFQEETRTRSWALSVGEHRRRVARHLIRAPGVRSVLSEVLEDAYSNGRWHALNETGLPRKAIPVTCPYTWDEIMTRPIEWPENP